MNEAAPPRPLAKAVAIFTDAPWIMPAILLLGAVMHLAYAFLNRLRPYTSEMHQVAVTLAQTGVIANPYKVMDGLPTTHVGPIAPALGALVYRLFGADTHTAEILLTLYAIGTVTLLLLLLYRLFALLGEGRLARRLAVLAAVLVPVDIETEARDFRIREGALAACTLTFLLVCLVRLDRDRRAGWRDMAALAFLASFLFLLSPSAAVPAFAACGVFALRRLPWRRWPATAVMAALILAACSFPWALRNKLDLGEWVWSRGNVGLELAVGTYPGAVAPADPVKAFVARLDEIHPYKSVAAYQRMRAAGGELAYARQMKAETWGWIGQHPGDAARIWLRHIREFYAPPRWLWGAYGELPPFTALRLYWTDLVLLAAAIALLTYLIQGRTRYYYILAVVSTAVLPYIVAQPRTRYRYTITSILVFLAVTGAVRLWHWTAARRGLRSTNQLA